MGTRSERHLDASDGGVTLVSTLVSILYFAGLREAVGLDEEAIATPPSVRTVGQLCAYLATIRPAYGERRASVRVARNEAFARDEDPVDDGDVIALIPPVAGG